MNVIRKGKKEKQRVSFLIQYSTRAISRINVAVSVGLGICMGLRLDDLSQTELII